VEAAAAETGDPPHAAGKFDVRGIFWRNALDWGVTRIPAALHPALIWFWSLFFFAFAASPRKAVQRYLRVIFPDASWWTILARTFRVFRNYAWCLTDSTAFRLSHASFSYDVAGDEFLADLGTAERAIMLTAHIGAYDLGAGLFTGKFARGIRMVRASEPNELTARHIDLALEQAGHGAVKVDYSSKGSLVAFDLLAAIRSGEIISIQGDRVIPNVARSLTKLFGQDVFLPTGPFVLSLVAEAAIYPVFVLRKGYRAYQIIAYEPIVSSKDLPREQAIEIGLTKWTGVLEQVIRAHWDQWFAFTPVFEESLRG
jgi:lauroyl/myristoyl acyltransferase